MHRLQDVGLVLLAVVAGLLTALTFSAVTGPGGGGGTDGDAAASVGTVGLADPAAVTSSSTDGSSTPEERTRASAGLGAARDVLHDEEPVVVAALGDSTGNETWEWVYEWGRTLAAGRPVDVFSWNEWTEDGYIEPVALGTDREGEPVTIYAGHQSGAGAAYPAERVEELVPEEPDLVILNYGHNDTVESVRTGTSGTVAALRRSFGADLPVVIILQQPQARDANVEVRRALADVAADEGLPTIDVAAAFEGTGDPAGLLADEVHPDENGALLWARTVGEALHAP